MFEIRQILTTVMVAVAMAPALAHTMEYLGKMRLCRGAYLSVQSIYYPGFTVAGRAAVLGMAGNLGTGSLASPAANQSRTENNGPDWRQ